MNKKWFIPIGIALSALIVGGVFVWRAGRSSQTISPGGEKVTATPTPAVELTTWRDEAGFSIQYPKELSVNKNENDNANYAHLELTHKDHPGKIIIWVKDLPAGVTTLESWVKKGYSGATTLDTMLGGEPAKKILTTAPVKMLTVGTISENLLFYVEGTLTDSDYWSSIHDLIIGSFAFTDGSTAAPNAGGASNTSGGGEVDEEEVLQ